MTDDFAKNSQIVDAFICNKLVQEDKNLKEGQKVASEAGIPEISVAPNQGKFLQLLVKLIHAERILEIGTLAGYSATWMASALPSNGKLVSLEFEPMHASVSRQNMARSGLESKVDIRIGAALELLPTIFQEFGRTFDLVFIDADKNNTPNYFEWALKLTRSGGLIITDNVVRNGEVANLESEDPNILGIQKFFEIAQKNQNSSTTAIQTVGSKGHDGFAFTLVS